MLYVYNEAQLRSLILQCIVRWKEGDATEGRLW